MNYFVKAWTLPKRKSRSSFYPDGYRSIVSDAASPVLAAKEMADIIFNGNVNAMANHQIEVETTGNKPSRILFRYHDGKVLEKVAVKKADKKATLNPSMTFGVMPTYAKFVEEFNEEVPGGVYPMHLKGEDLKAARGTRFCHSGEQQFEVDDLYIGVVELLEKWEEGDDDAGSLASGILGTLGFEWI